MDSSRAKLALLIAAGLGFSAVLRLWAASPLLTDISPTGAQRGTECELTFTGDRLQDTEEVICYEPEIQIVKLGTVTNKTVQATVKTAADCKPGEYHLRLRSRTGLSEIRTFWVGPFPTVAEAEPNDDPAKAQKVPLNTTVTGVIKSEDVDYFAVELKKDQRLSAEVQGMRLGRADFDPRLCLLDPAGAVVADSDDTWLGRQDPLISVVAPKDGTYIVRLREAAYQGNDNCQYRLHLGAFARPTAVLPAGGKAGETNAFVFINPGGASFTNALLLPAAAEEKFGIFPEVDSQVAPTPNWVRVSGFPNVLAPGTNTSRESATGTTLPPPLALNGAIQTNGQENWFSFPAAKGVALNVNVFARRLHSPMDSIVEVFDSKGQALGANDDSAGADSSLKFTPGESTNYFVRIRDTLGNGGPDFVYRVEITPDLPSLALKIPEVARNDTQSRQYAVVPRGNRFATLISARRANLSGELSFEIKELPAGVVMSTNRMAANVDSMPVVFEAAPDAAVGAKLLDFIASGANGTNAVSGKFVQGIDLVYGPNNATYYSTSVDKFCVAVTKEAPFKVRIVEPKVPLVQGGSMALQLIAERAASFDEPIELKMVWNPPGISSQPEVTISKGATNAVYTLNAAPGAEARTWKIAVLASAAVEGGQVYVSSQLADLEVAAPYLAGKIETLWINPGKTGKLTVSLQPAKPFEGKSKIRLAGLPERVTAAEREIGKDDQEIVFDVAVETNCPAGSHKNLFCTVDVQDKGTVVPHTIAAGGILRIVPPKKAEAVAAATEKK